MNLIELNRSLVQLRLSGIAAVMETRLLQAQSESMAPIDLISMLVSDELACRSKRLLDRRNKQAQFRDANKLLDSFDFQFNPKMNRALIFDLATAAFIGRQFIVPEFWLMKSQLHTLFILLPSSALSLWASMSTTVHRTFSSAERRKRDTCSRPG